MSTHILFSTTSGECGTIYDPLKTDYREVKNLIMSERQQKYYAELHRRARRNRKTITEALKWLDDNYTGDTRKAHRHQMEAEPWQLNVESQLRMIYKNLIKMEKPQPASRS